MTTVLVANKEIAVRWLELVGAHDIDAILAMTSLTWRMHGGPPNLPLGHDGMRLLFATMGRIEQRWTVHDVIAEGDRVLVRASNEVEQDSFLGIPARGIVQRFTAMFLHRITDDVVQETWRNADDLGRVLQLGATLRMVSDA